MALGSMLLFVKWAFVVVWRYAPNYTPFHTEYIRPSYVRSTCIVVQYRGQSTPYIYIHIYGVSTQYKVLYELNNI